SLLTPVLATIFIILIGERNKSLRNGIIILTCLFDFILVLRITKGVLAGIYPSFTLVETPLFVLQFQVDKFGLFMGLLVSFLWIFTELYSFGYMSGEHQQTRYFACLTFALTATLGIVFAANLLTLFIFYELLTYVVYPLVIHEETEEAFRAGVIYFVYLLTGGLTLLFAIFLTYKLTGGNISFTPTGISELGGQNRNTLYLLFILFMLGFGFKSTLMPLHSWLPRAMIAPTPISALLHAVAVVKVGLFGIIRTIYCVFGADLFRQLNLNLVLGIWASITILIAAFTALRQTKIKRMLAYSTINQLSFVILGAASANPLGLFAALLHFVYHSFMKITLFYTAGAIIKQTGKSMIKEMAGLAKFMPLTCFAFAIGAWGIVGLPPVAGWVSKFYLVKTYFTLGQFGFVFIYLLSSFIELGFFLPPIVYAYFKSEIANSKFLIPNSKNLQSEIGNLKLELRLSMLIPILTVAFISLIFGIWGGAPHILAKAIVAEFFK
ncbi:MAG TPA: hypothetical protein DHV62_07255, partial [Elusimicrobia bacterium]|nr:hypothetical protein [Elusimicrobiota bacterium]